MQKEKRRMMWVVLAVLVTLLSAVGLTYAWMAQRASMTTLLTITPPDTITIIPTRKDGSPMTELDLDYDEKSDQKDDDGTIHIYRPVCIKSTEPVHQLEIVHTTNLNDLDFKIYPAKKNDSGISYNPEQYLSGAYKNQDGTAKLAKEEALENYSSTADVADRNAYPLYWVTGDCDADLQNQETGADGKTNYNTYYILEISWKVETKETDLFYIMAQNVAQ